MGNFSTSKISFDLACAFIFSWPKSISFICIVTSTVPVCAAASSVIVPEVLLILPRQLDKPPMWSAVKLDRCGSDRRCI